MVKIAKGVVEIAIYFVSFLPMIDEEKNRKRSIFTGYKVYFNRLIDHKCRSQSIDNHNISYAHIAFVDQMCPSKWIDRKYKK